MKKTITAISLSLGIISVAIAQTGFIKTYGTATCYEEATSVVATSNGYLVSAATNCGGGAQNWNSYLFEINNSGDTLWTKANLAANGKLITTNDGHLLFAGGNIAGNAYDTIVISKTTNAGQAIWSKSFSFSACKNTISKVIEVADGYIATGYFATQSCLNPVYDAFVMKLDLNGHVVWSEKIDGVGMEQLHDVVATPAGKIAAFGWTNTETGNNLNDYLLVVLDANGKLENRKQFGDEYNNFGYGLSVAFDGGLITNGYSNTMEVYKLDADLNIEWHQNYNSTCGSTYFKVAQTTDGGYAFLGTEDISGQCNALFMKTDSLGNMLWKKNWDARLREFIEQADGSFVLAGYANYLPDAVVILFDSTSLLQPAVIANTTETVVDTVADQNVQDVLDSMGVSTSVDEEALNERTGTIKLYPNPAINVLNIEFTNDDNEAHALSIYSVTGSLVYYQDDIQQSKISVDITELVAGAYIYQLSGGTRFYAGQFIVQ